MVYSISRILALFQGLKYRRLISLVTAHNSSQSINFYCLPQTASWELCATIGFSQWGISKMHDRQNQIGHVTLAAIIGTTILVPYVKSYPLRRRHNGQGSASNDQPHHCLINSLLRRRSKKTSKLRVTGLYKGNSPVIGEFPAQMANNVENVSIWWRHHAL